MKSSPNWNQVLSAASGDVRRLSYVDRYTSIPVSFKENVAEHSYWVALYAALIHQEVSADTTLYAPIVTYALVHDIVECVSGDLVRTFKYSTEELKQAVDAAEEKLVSGFPTELKSLMSLPWTLIQHEGDNAYVKSVVKLADFVSLHQYMVRERMRGNSEIRPFFDRMQKDMRMMAKKYRENADVRVQSMAGLFDEMAVVEDFSPRTT